MASFGGGVIIEIGPGKGAITKALLEKGEKVVAIEMDEELIPGLQEKFKEYDNFHLIQGDVLEFNTSELQNYGKTYTVVANIPYYITGAIIRHFLESEFQPDSMTLLVQKEVAERIVSRDGKESILSLSVKAYGNPKYIMKVGREYFTPKPDIDSAIIHIADISKGFFEGFSEEQFFEIVKKAFQFKRKTLVNNLKDSFETIESILEELDIPLNTRAEDLNLSLFAELTKKIAK